MDPHMYEVSLLWRKGMIDKQITRLLVHRNIMPKANDVSIKSTYSWCDLLRLNGGSWFLLVDKIS